VTKPLHVSLVALIAGGRSGVPRYAAALSRALDEVAGEFEGLALTLLTTPAGADAIGARALRVRRVSLASGAPSAGAGRVVLEQILAATARADLLHFFDVNGPLLAPWRGFTMTIHDASVVRRLRPRRHDYKRLVWPWAMRRARAVVAVSQFAHDEAIRLLSGDPGRIVVARSGPGFLADARGDGAAEATDGTPYLLYVGNITAAKNLRFLVRAFDQANLAARLVLAGPRVDGFEELRDEIDRTVARERIVLTEHVSDAELDRLYRGAVALVLPSRYEGFGFTPLEAMARGCPVVASDIPAIREISGDGALLVPLDDVAAWARAMQLVSADTSFRDELRRRGADVVSRYSWAETARAVCRVFLAADPRRAR
jgi:glycosyltransferase involved in cell wall biosynthesis